MAVDLKGLSPKELQALIDSAKSQLSEVAASHAQETRDKIIAHAREAGYELGDLFGFGKGKGKRGVAAAPAAKIVKYRSPSNAALTWAGRGKRPRWVNEWLANGGSLEALLAK